MKIDLQRRQRSGKGATDVQALYSACEKEGVMKNMSRKRCLRLWNGVLLAGLLLVGMSLSVGASELTLPTGEKLTLVWEDNFDNYSLGANMWSEELIENWPNRHIPSGVLAVVTDEEFVSAPYSLKVTDHGYFRRGGIQITSSRIVIEYKIMKTVQEESLTGRFEFFFGSDTYLMMCFPGPEGMWWHLPIWGGGSRKIEGTSWEAGKWYHVRIVLDADADMWDLYIDDMDTPVAENLLFTNPTISFWNVQVGFMGTENPWYIDDFRVYEVE